MGQNHPSEAQLVELARADPEVIGKLAFALFERLAFLQGRLEKRRCRECGTVLTAAFPEGVAATVQ